MKKYPLLAENRFSGIMDNDESTRGPMGDFVYRGRRNGRFYGLSRLQLICFFKTNVSTLVIFLSEIIMNLIYSIKKNFIKICEFFGFRKHYLDINDIYTTLSQARDEIKTRWENEELRRRVEKYWGGEIPGQFNVAPRAILSRGILTPSFETQYFIDLLGLINLKPICLEFAKDKFCSQNIDKIHLGKLIFFHRHDKNGKKLTTKKTIIDFKRSDNKNFDEIRTIGDKDFIEFHHDIYKKHHNDMMDIFDISHFKGKRESAREVYEKIFSLCIMSGVLFENFIMKDSHGEKKFSQKIVAPALAATIKRFGVKPLVVPLLPIENEDREEWIWYPGHLEQYIEVNH